MDIKIISEKQNSPPGSPLSQAHESGNLFMLLSFDDSNQSHGIKGIQFARDIVSSFQKELEDLQNSQSPLQSLSTAVKSASRDAVKFSAVNFDLENKIIFAALSPGSRLTLLRNARETLLVTGESATPSGSGEFMGGDIFTLSHSSGAKIVLKIKTETPITQTIPTQPTKIDKQSTFGLLHASSSLVSKASRIPFSLVNRRPRREKTTLLEDKKKSKAPLVGAMLLVLLLVSIFFGIRQKNKQERVSQYLPILEEARHELSEAEALAGLNPARARQLVLGAKTKAEELSLGEYNDPEIIRLNEQITSALGPIAGIYNVTPEIFLDLNILRQGLVADEVSFADNAIKVLDTQNQRLVSIDTETKNTSIIAAKEDLFNAFNLAAYTDKNFVLSADGIRGVGGQVELLLKPEDWNPKSALIQSFAGNMYILDKQNNDILRAPGISSGFAQAASWLAPGISSSLGDAISWSIDGSIWVLHAGGEVGKYTQGLPENFQISQTPSSLENATKIFTSDESEGLYFLDPINKRILVTDKQGNFKAEYLSDSLAEAQNFVVSEKSQKIIFTVDSLLYSIELKHVQL